MSGSEAMAARSVVICGHVTLDRVGDELLPGGSVYYAAQAHRALGAQVRAVTAAGPDFPAGALAGVEASVTAAARTTRFVNTYALDGRRAQRVEAAAPPISPGQAPAAWLTCDLLHLAPVLGELDLPAWRAATRSGLIGIGVQGWVRDVAPGGAVVPRPFPFDAAALAGVGAACLGDDDAAGQGDLIDRLVEAVPIVAFTHGARGCEVIVRGRTTRVGVHPAREIDPTGAGDVFAAGFFLALVSGADPVEAARLGAAAASIVVEGRAGEALPRVGEARARVGAVPVPRDA